MKNVLGLGEITADDSEKVGKKGANLGELRNNIDVPVLTGYVTSTEAFEDFIDETGLREKIERLLDGIDTRDIRDLQRRGEQIRSLIQEEDIPENIRSDFEEAYRSFSEELDSESPEVAVRTSTVTEEDELSFAEWENSYLNVSGQENIIERIKDCYASFFSNSAISYREDHGIPHFDAGISVIVQKMGRSDIGSAGAMFTAEPDSGFDRVVTINSSYGFGEYVNEGKVNPDEFTVFKKNLGIVERNTGEKRVKLVRNAENENNDSEKKNIEKKVPEKDREKLSLTDNQVRELAKYGLRIEEHYDQSMSIEWLLDGKSHELYIVDAEPLKLSEDNGKIIEEHRLQEKSEVLAEGSAIGSKIISGEANILSSPKNIDQFKDGEILVTDTTGPEWEPIMEKAGAVICNKGGTTSHTSIVSRELDLPTVTGAENTTSKISDGQKVTVDCSSSKGKIWDGELDYSDEEHNLGEIPETKTDIQLNLSDPSEAFHLAKLPVDGIGLLKIESIVSNHISEHPLKLIEEDRGEEYVEAIKSGIGEIGVAFHPDQVAVMLSDFTSDEYSEMEGGEDFEPEESNPEIGLRGSSRYHDEVFSQVFELECKALRECIDELGLDNITVTVPFCRTIEDAKNAKAKMKEYGLDRDDTEIELIADLQSNIILADKFSEYFDGFRVRTEKLAQSTLGVKKDSDTVGYLFDKHDQAVQKSVETLISKSHRNDKEVSVSDKELGSEESYLEFLVETGVDKISVSPENAFDAIFSVQKAEEKVPDIRKESHISGKGSTDGFEIEVDVQTSIGSSAGEIYDTLKDRGESKANQLLNYTAEKVDDQRLHEGLGWLAKENKIEMNKEDGEVKYSLK